MPLHNVSNESQFMNETLDVKTSNLPAHFCLLLIFVIMSGALLAVLGPVGIIGCVVVIVWSLKVLFDLVRWLRLDKDTRPKMRFPKKTALALLVLIFAVGYFMYLIARDLGTP